MDKSLQQLHAAIAASAGPSLWLADEQVGGFAPAARADLAAVSNRCDVVAWLRGCGIDAALSDFEFAAAGYAHVFFRVAKEKALVHHAINRALEALAPGGTLWLAGDKHDGIKTYLDKATAYAGGDRRIERNGTSLLGAITAGSALDPQRRLDDQAYTELRRIDFSAEFSAWTKPGVFGWQKIDAGSALLIEQLGPLWPQPPRRVLDLGCGYGYLGLRAASHWPQARFIATDNNIAAVRACARNFAEFGIDGAALCSDVGADIDERFDAVLCNPPFHQGFDVEDELTARFLRATRRLLARGGRALFVVNQFIPLERLARAHFGEAEVVARNRSFKLVLLAP